jgi:transcription-repair coupling factor (superfamily II helicase)
MSSGLSTLFAEAGRSSRLSFSGLAGSSLAYVLAELFVRSKAPLALWVPHSKMAQELQEDLSYYLGSEEDILVFPSLGILPYYGLNPNPDAVAERMAFLYALLRRRSPYLAILPISAAMRRLPPRGIFDAYSEYVVSGAELDREGLLKKLVESGYLNVPLVEDKGTFSKRGGILDLFSPQEGKPVRLEFFGDQVESLKAFDPETQRTLHSREDLMTIPAREVVFNEETLSQAAHRFRERANELALAKPERESFLDGLRQRLAPVGLDTFLPLFYEKTETVFGYLPPKIRSVWLEPELCQVHHRELLAEAQAGHAGCETLERVVAPAELFLNWEEIESARDLSEPWEYRELARGNDDFSFQTQTHEELSTLLKHAPIGEGMLSPLIDRLQSWRREGFDVRMISGTHTQFLRTKDLLERFAIPLLEGAGSPRDRILNRAGSSASVCLLEGHLSKGFVWPEARLVILTDQDVFGEKQRRRAATAKKAEAFTSFEEIREGDFIVHEDHGLGVYRGLTPLNLEGTLNDFLVVEYLGGDKLYLPVYRLNLVSRYAAHEGFVPRLDRMGGTSWEKSKAKVRKALRAMAGELLKLYAERATQSGYAFSPRGVLYEEFEATFPFEETPDQLKAIDEINRDMDEARPMDRLICGDVGFGKTEVAMRAAFRAILDNKQVAILVPTTVLALQHERNFRTRFQNFPAVIEMHSRFVPPKRQKEILEKLKTGKVDIIVGTHGLLGKEVHWKDLGLLIIDEEHRFGVAQKEKIKQLKKMADVATLTATPIPRTLNMALSGIRDLSVIATPPVDRMAVQTFVASYNEALIREAILRELSRGGQVYFVHNRVQNIQAVYRRLVELIPEAKIQVGHGQMPEKELEQVMIGFLNREFNVFLCTSIIESGLDVPSANTMVINRADGFGLAQLYQLRGRIGRSNQRAYAYLLIPGQEAITPQARARLSVLQRYTELGSGFKIAAHDLEIRGAGNLLGPEQSGHIAAVGYDLYMKLMEEAMLEVKGEEKVEAPDPELQLKLPASIPDAYIPETTMRLTFYKRFAAVQDEEELMALAEEVEDRFGRLPSNLQNLLTVMRVKILARRAWLKLVRLEARRVLFVFDPNAPLDAAHLGRMLAKEPERFRWLKPHELAMGVKEGKEDKDVEAIEAFLANLKTA